MSASSTAGITLMDKFINSHFFKDLFNSCNAFLASSFVFSFFFFCFLGQMLVIFNIICLGKPGFGHHAEKDIPEKFLVTSKVVNIAPCIDRKEGKKKEMMMGERKEERLIKRL